MGAFRPATETLNYTGRADFRIIRCDFEKVADKPTITKLRVVSRHQQLIRLDFEEPFDAQSAASLSIRAESLLDNTDVLILSDYAKGALDDVSNLIRKAKKAGVKVLVDPKGHDYSCYRGATLLTPNLQEFEQIMGPCSSEEELAAKGMTLIKELGLEALLITRGEHGMSLIRDNAPELHIPARTRDVFDVTGAGDTVISALGAALAAVTRSDTEHSLRSATAPAGHTEGQPRTCAEREGMRTRPASLPVSPVQQLPLRLRTSS